MPTDLERIEEAIVENVVSGVQSVTVDGLSVQSKNVRELIEAAEYLKEESAGPTPSRGLRFTKCILPGTG